MSNIVVEIKTPPLRFGIVSTVAATLFFTICSRLYPRLAI